MKNAVNAMDEKSAKLEVEKWLDFKRVKPKKRTDNEDSIQIMIEAFEEGVLTLDEKTHEITQHLTFEAAGKKSVTYKPRLKVGESQRRLKGVKSTDGHAMLMAYVSELTGENSAVISDFDSEDYGIARTIATFFF